LLRVTLRCWPLTHRSRRPERTTLARAFSVGTADHDEGKRIFDEKQLWGASFGMLADRFGIEWMINAG
jgi:predicted 3-demethylubiquinone-9 3-methyltransferase (glyoxalase superfamily)